ncbi:putative metal-dependent hydrolase [Pseudooceanicola batsensis HTCC2597]|uniref:Putative metal-dependent hydrolase n=1 Tax=Pseudooceanicola batsensis (strain ATCC BAA-863 / DSM 15984 / KCTC 12145 / HTCC2597) TaxID=252305 RepID=A3TTB9_PSEBH|nr:MBL fold metallo-hydrolase [Pseudooceanicola batsensis]EAQ04896.1 putative metal-dependent hydrolase [Pseudooceanicola batsensis HTCC2597]
MLNRRTLLLTGAAATGATLIRPYAAMAESHGEMGGDTYPTDGGEITIHPVSHASFVMETPAGVIYVDPVGGGALYDDFPAPDLILLTHHHGDHFDPETLETLWNDDIEMIANPTVFEKLPEKMKAKTASMSNGDTGEARGLPIEAIPAYNTTEDRLQYHPEGRDNGYIVTIDGLRVYIAGDTEDIPEMRALENIDIAFVPFNLPYTMDEEQAASAVAEFAPRFVYPYHYRDSDPELFKRLLNEANSDPEVRMGPWYGQSI